MHVFTLPTTDCTAVLPYPAVNANACPLSPTKQLYLFRKKVNKHRQLALADTSTHVHVKLIMRAIGDHFNKGAIRHK